MSRYVSRWVSILVFGCLIGVPVLVLWGQDVDEDGLIAGEELLIDEAIEGDMETGTSVVEKASTDALVADDVLVEDEAAPMEEKGVPMEETAPDAEALTADDLVFEMPSTGEVAEAEEPETAAGDEMMAEETTEEPAEGAEEGVEADEGLVIDLPFDLGSEEETGEEATESAMTEEPAVAEESASIEGEEGSEAAMQEAAETADEGAEGLVVELPGEEAPAETTMEEAAPAEEPEMEAPAVMTEAAEETQGGVAESTPPEEAAAEEMPEEMAAEEAPVEVPADVVDLDRLVEQEFTEAVQEGIPEAPAAEAEAAQAEAEMQPPAVVEGAVEAPSQPMPVKPPVPPAPVVDKAAMAARAEAAKRASEIQLLREGEVLRRRAFEKHADSLLDEADGEKRERRYEAAIRLYQEALGVLRGVARPENKSAQRRAVEGIRDSYYALAVRYLDRRALNEAQGAAEQAERYGHPKAGAVLAQIQKIQAGEEAPPPVEPEPRRWKQKEYLDKQADIAERLRQGREFMVSEEYDRAQFMFESVLKREPHNTEAIRMLQKVSSRQYDLNSLELEATRDHMMADLRGKWNKRPYAPEEDRERFETVTQGARPPPLEMEQRKKIKAKMENIIIPELDFRQAHIRDVIDFLSQASVDFDDPNLPESEKGVNIILKLDVGAAPSSMPEPEFPAFPAETTVQPAAGGVTQHVTFNARYISLLEALKIVCDVAGLKYRIEPNLVMVLPQNAPETDIINRTYNIVPTTITRLRGFAREISTSSDRGGGDFTALGGGGGVAGETTDLKDFFGELGVDWPQGSSIQYIEPLGKLVVANTVDNLAVFESILPELDLVPKQVEIEARFVEVIRTDLDALGVEWLLTDDWEVAEKKGQGNVPLGGRQRIVVRENEAQGGFTTGNRFLSGGIEGLDAVVLPNSEVLRIASVLTNPELEMVLHALEQRGNADVLSAPKVMTQSGSEATIKVVTEYIYPTDFEVTPVTAELAGGGSQIIGGVVEPSGFETREVGVILSVLPDVSPEGQMINLTLQPEVVDEPTFKNYGTTFTDPSGNVQQLNMEQPFFFTRTIQTSILIYNGATVVMGGMITEKRQDVDDKVPFIGDIPVIGRLFRSRYDRNEKRNLLIFVTARLVDPAGLPLGRAKNRLAEDLLENKEAE